MAHRDRRSRRSCSPAAASARSLPRTLDGRFELVGDPHRPVHGRRERPDDGTTRARRATSCSSRATPLTSRPPGARAASCAASSCRPTARRVRRQRRRCRGQRHRPHRAAGDDSRRRQLPVRGHRRRRADADRDAIRSAGFEGTRDRRAHLRERGGRRDRSRWRRSDRFSVTVHDSTGAIAANATVTIIAPRQTRATAAVEHRGPGHLRVPAARHLHGRRAIARRQRRRRTRDGETSTAGGQTVEVPIGVPRHRHGRRSPSWQPTASRGSKRARRAERQRRPRRLGAPGALPRRSTASRTASGVVTFENVPVGAFFVTAEAARARRRQQRVRLTHREARRSVTVRLGASGSVAGRVLLPDGITPAAQAIVTLRFTPQSTLQSGVLQVTTEPHRHVRVHRHAGRQHHAVAPSRSSAAACGSRTGQIAANGQRARRRRSRSSTTPHRGSAARRPPTGSIGVARQPSLAVTFSEPMRPVVFLPSPATATFADGRHDRRRARAAHLLQRRPHADDPAAAGAAQQCRAQPGRSAAARTGRATRPPTCRCSTRSSAPSSPRTTCPRSSSRAVRPRANGRSARTPACASRSRSRSRAAR